MGGLRHGRLNKYSRATTGLSRSTRLSGKFDRMLRGAGAEDDPIVRNPPNGPTLEILAFAKLDDVGPSGGTK
jgi:hypothetical protein